MADMDSRKRWEIYLKGIAFPDTPLPDPRTREEMFLKAIANKNHYVTPDMFGAVGNGIADDSAAFEAAVATGYPVIGRPGKQYKVHDIELHNVTISNCFFNGQDKTLTCLNIRSGVVIEDCEFYNFNICIAKKAGSNIVDSSIRGTTFAYSKYGIYLDCSVNGSYDGTSLNDVIIENNYIAKCGEYVDDMSHTYTAGVGYGIYLNGAVNGVYITHNVMEYNSYTGVYVNNTNNNYRVGVFIRENYFEGNKYSAGYVNVTSANNYIAINDNYYSSSNTNVFYMTRIYYAAGNTYLDVRDSHDISIIKCGSSAVPTLYIRPTTHDALMTDMSTQYITFGTCHLLNSYGVGKIIYTATLSANVNVRNSSNTQTLFTFENGSHVTFGNIPSAVYFSRLIGASESVQIHYMGRA